MTRTYCKFVCLVKVPVVFLNICFVIYRKLAKNFLVTFLWMTFVLSLGERGAVCGGGGRGAETAHDQGGHPEDEPQEEDQEEDQEV